jgi:hypothetical protein
MRVGVWHGLWEHRFLVVMKVVVLIALGVLVASGCSEDEDKPSAANIGSTTSEASGLTPASRDWRECVARFGAAACREGVGSYAGGPLADVAVSVGEYTCYGSVNYEVDDAEAAADEADDRRVSAKRRAQSFRRRLNALEQELAALESDQSVAGIEAYNAKVDEFNALRGPHNAAVDRANGAIRRYNQLARDYNRLLDEECEKEGP